ncbi:ABC transporter permease [Mycoplasma miroungirhinis]|uniref:ABC transporter permease n=1 Tax=Mycoplasma miroungirhinis TaxID=754516 RepID=A0A6M4JB68_9MOLU|nr:ABC transporter permease [Mycoplasma miroungirhinis]QJR44234.1 ABC transporter permease [Mycoplasma miroungirhinis]
MNNFILKLQNIVKNASVFIRMEQQKSSLRKVASSIWAIVFGIVISMIFVATSNKNPVEFFNIIFSKGLYGDKFLIGYLAIFLLGSLGVGLGFKSGYFNIGVSGQMMFGSLISFLVIYKAMDPREDLSKGSLVLLMLISTISGALLAMIAGLLKAFFNVHEVISTILLNWIVVYLCVYIFNWVNNAIWSDPIISKQFLLNTGDGTQSIKISEDNKIAFITATLILGIFIALILWFIFSKTTIGYKVKMVGLSKSNAKYSGINEKTIVISVLTISGALSGLAGFIYYIILQSKMVDLTIPLNIGFDTIAISLLALNAPIGIIFTSLFYAVLKNGQTSLFLIDLNGESMYMVTGLIIFMAALSIMFNSFRPIYLIRRFFLLHLDKEWKESYKKYKIKLSQLNKSKIEDLKKAKQEHKDNKKAFLETKKTINKKINNLLFTKIQNYTDDEKLQYYAKLSALKTELNIQLDNLGFYNYKNKKNLHKSLKISHQNEFKKTTEFKHNELLEVFNAKLSQMFKIKKIKGAK